MKKIKITKHVVTVYEPTDGAYDEEATIEEMAKSDVKMVSQFGETYFLGDINTRKVDKTITWEIVEED